jgi:hypothetical protein
VNSSSFSDVNQDDLRVIGHQTGFGVHLNRDFKQEQDIQTFFFGFVDQFSFRSNPQDCHAARVLNSRSPSVSESTPVSATVTTAFTSEAPITAGCAGSGGKTRRLTWTSWIGAKTFTASVAAITTLKATTTATCLRRVFQDCPEGPSIDSLLESLDHVRPQITSVFGDQATASCSATAEEITTTSFASESTRASRGRATAEALSATAEVISSTAASLTARAALRELLCGTDRFHIRNIGWALEGNSSAKSHSKCWTLESCDPLNACQQIGPTLGTRKCMSIEVFECFGLATSLKSNLRCAIESGWRRCASTTRGTIAAGYAFATFAGAVTTRSSRSSWSNTCLTITGAVFAHGVTFAWRSTSAL